MVTPSQPAEARGVAVRIPRRCRPGADRAAAPPETSARSNPPHTGIVRRRRPRGDHDCTSLSPASQRGPEASEPASSSIVTSPVASPMTALVASSRATVKVSSSSSVGSSGSARPREVTPAWKVSVEVLARRFSGTLQDRGSSPIQRRGTAGVAVIRLPPWEPVRNPVREASHRPHSHRPRPIPRSMCPQRHPNLHTGTRSR